MAEIQHGHPRWQGGCLGLRPGQTHPPEIQPTEILWIQFDTQVPVFVFWLLYYFSFVCNKQFLKGSLNIQRLSEGSARSGPQLFAWNRRRLPKPGAVQACYTGTHHGQCGRLWRWLQIVTDSWVPQYLSDSHTAVHKFSKTWNMLSQHLNDREQSNSTCWTSFSNFWHCVKNRKIPNHKRETFFPSVHNHLPRVWHHQKCSR